MKTKLENVAVTVVLPPEGSCCMGNIFYILKLSGITLSINTLTSLQISCSAAQALKTKF